ncbi:hypothetical protein [Staphylococcus argensis]|nr:hypothetical protein [Staphylococcus argensis]
MGENVDGKEIEEEVDSWLVNSDEVEGDWSGLCDRYGWVICEA